MKPGSSGHAGSYLHLTLGLVLGLEVVGPVICWGGGHETEFRLYTHIYRGTCEQEVCSIRENRSKLFFSSSGFLFTWQVSRLTLAGGLFGCKTTRGGETSALTEPHSDIKHLALHRKDPETVTESVLLYTITWTIVGSQLGSAHSENL